MDTIKKPAMTAEMQQKIQEAGVIAVLVIDDVRHAVPAVKALLKGGVKAIELTLRTPAAYEAARVIKREVPEMLLGFGTVITKEQVQKAVAIGADFAVAPGCNVDIIDEARRLGLNFGPGIMTPSEIEMAVEHGCQTLKYFPAETSGGMTNLKSMVAPYQYLGLKFIPLGGLNEVNTAAYFASPLISAIGGSWIAKRPLIQAEDWETITANAKAVMALMKQVRKG